MMKTLSVVVALIFSLPLVGLADVSPTSRIKQKFTNPSPATQKVRVLIVPGHEPVFGGTEYRDLKERDMVLGIARELASYLRKNPHYEVFEVRTDEGWSPEFDNYFKNNWNEISAFVDQKKREYGQKVALGNLVEVGDGMPHNDAPSDVALRLFGITKWANEHDIDITIHLHINDSYPRKATRPGEYSGFAIYMPERQFDNAEVSQALARSIFGRLSKLFAVSNLDQESNGLIQNQDLIAIGSNNTAKSASILIEYGYIYEPKFQNANIRPTLYKEFALQTYLGIEDFFGEDAGEAGPYETSILPYRWSEAISKSTRASTGALALQAALAHRGFYPPYGMTKNDCPLSGVYGSCTKRAVAQFQKKFGIQGDGSLVGTQTRAALNRLYGN